MDFINISHNWPCLLLLIFNFAFIPTFTNAYFKQSSLMHSSLSMTFIPTFDLHGKANMKITELQMSTLLNNEQIEKLSPRKLVQLGMIYFKQGDVESSIEIFDRAEKLDDSLTPYLWQRGISYYYVDRFQDGSDQFRYDVKVNPLDVEEIVWDIACQYMANRKNEKFVVDKMSLPKGKTDRRKIMVSLVVLLGMNIVTFIIYTLGSKLSLNF